MTKKTMPCNDNIALWDGEYYEVGKARYRPFTGNPYED